MFTVWVVEEDHTAGFAYSNEAHRLAKPYAPIAEYQLKYPLSIHMTGEDLHEILDPYSENWEVVYKWM